MNSTLEHIPEKSARKPDCATEVRMGNTVLIVSGFLKPGSGETAADKMAKVIAAEGMLKTAKAESDG